MKASPTEYSLPFAFVLVGAIGIAFATHAVGLTNFGHIITGMVHELRTGIPAGDAAMQGATKYVLGVGFAALLLCGIGLALIIMHLFSGQAVTAPLLPAQRHDEDSRSGAH